MVFLLFSIFVTFFLSWSFSLKTCWFVDLVVLFNFSGLVYALASARQFTHHFTANRWGNSGSSDRLYFGGSKITADVTAAMKLRPLLLGRKVMNNLDSMLKSRDITLPTKVRLVKAMVFPVVMYGCESWSIKKAEHWRIDAFELWCWRRLLRVPRTASRSNQSILKEISPEYSLEGLMLKLKLQYFAHLMRRADSFEKTLILGLPQSSVGEKFICNEEDLGLIPGFGRPTGEDPDAEKDWRQEEKGTEEDEMVGWHHLLSVHEFE